MKSTDSIYLQGVDHLRAFAAFAVFFWHATHSAGGVAASYVPDSFILRFFEEGHTGVSLFITITGFIFSYIIGERRII